VFNWKLSAIAGGIGLGLSLIVGLFSGAGFSHSLLRSLIFGAVFFGLGTGVWFLINTFLPELLVSGAADGDGMKPGSRINIAEDEKILPEVFKSLDEGEDVGDIGSLVNGTFKPIDTPVPALAPASAPDIEGQGLDQMPEDGYTESRSAQVSAAPPEGGLPDLDLLGGSFLDGDEAEDSGERPEPVRRPAGNKPESLKGDFDPKDLAKGIQTILKEDK